MPVRPSVRLSVRPCAKVMYTKTQERVKIIDCGFFCLNAFRLECTKTYEAKAK